MNWEPMDGAPKRDVNVGFCENPMNTIVNVISTVVNAAFLTGLLVKTI